jgi:hypothetical protein
MSRNFVCAHAFRFDTETADHLMEVEIENADDRGGRALFQLVLRLVSHRWEGSRLNSTTSFQTLASGL